MDSKAKLLKLSFRYGRCWKCFVGHFGQILLRFHHIRRHLTPFEKLWERISRGNRKSDSQMSVGILRLKFVWLPDRIGLALWWYDELVLWWWYDDVIMLWRWWYDVMQKIWWWFCAAEQDKGSGIGKSRQWQYDVVMVIWWYDNDVVMISWCYDDVMILCKRFDDDSVQRSKTRGRELAIVRLLSQGRLWQISPISNLTIFNTISYLTFSRLFFIKICN